MVLDCISLTIQVDDKVKISLVGLLIVDWKKVREINPIKLPFFQHSSNSEHVNSHIKLLHDTSRPFRKIHYFQINIITT